MQFFKVTTSDRKSLGLRNNPTILTFPLGKWIKSPTVKEGNSDDGGIWAATTLSNARRLKKYMLNRHGKHCRIFRATIGRVLFKNSYRVKTDKIRCEEEILGRCNVCDEEFYGRAALDDHIETEEHKQNVLKSSIIIY